MGNENPIRTLGDYSKLSHEGYRNTIELPVGNNVVPLRSDTIRLVQNGCSFHGLRSEDPNQHLKDFLKLMDSLDLDGSISTWEDLTNRFLAQLFPPGRTAKLRNDILMQTIDQLAGGKLRDLNAEESWALLEDLALYDNESWNNPMDFAKPVKQIALPQMSDAQRLMEAHLAPTQPTQVNKVTTPCEICSGPYDTLYYMEDPNKPLLNTHPRVLMKREAHFKEATTSQTSLLQPEIENKPSQPEEPEPALEDEFQDLHLNLLVLEVLAHAPIYNINIGLLEETDHIFGLADGTKSYPVGIVKDAKVHIGKLKLLNDLYVLDMKKDLETPLLVGRGFLATANVVIDCRMAKIVVGEGITRIGAKPPYYARKDFLDCHLPREWEISRDVELNPFKDTLVFRRMVEFLGAIPINLNCNMWESEDLIKKPINWDKPPKNRDGAWHAKIRLIDPDGEEFTKTLQSIPTTRKLSERESPREIIDLDHFYDT
ncbi:MAK10-like protein [Tanacetum coccineum]